MRKLDLTDEDMDRLFADEMDAPLRVVIRTHKDADVARLMRMMDRDIKAQTHRPSNAHPRSPRKRK